MIQKRKPIFVLSGFVFAGLMVACVAGPGAEETIRFGVIQPLTGPVADAGSYVLHGLTIGFEKINSEGGVCGRLLEPVVLDGRNDPQESANAAENLITREKVPIIMGAWGSSSTLAVMPVMERHGVPLVVETSSSQKVTTPGTPGFEWVHRISATSAMEAEAATPYVVDVLGMNNVAILSVNNDWGRGAGEVFRQAIEGRGGRIISEDYVDQVALDVLPQLTKIKSSEANAILMTTGAGQIAMILKQYNELGMDQTILTTGGSNYPIAIMDLSSPEMVNGTYHLMFYVPTEYDLAGDPEISEWYYKEYTDRGYAEMGRGESYRGFDAVHVIAKAIELNNCSLDPKGLNDALTRVEFAGLGGHVRFDDANGRQSRPNIYLVRVEDGQLKPLQGPHSDLTPHRSPGAAIAVPEQSSTR
jgi:branched-chain amino acid transport system substrate-binding protein